MKGQLVPATPDNLSPGTKGQDKGGIFRSPCPLSPVPGPGDGNEETPSPGPVTWGWLARRLPALARLRAEARAIRDDGTAPTFCANDIWYDDFKPRLSSLVGWGAESDDPLLQSSTAYDIAYDLIYDELPPCRNCGCLDLDAFVTKWREMREVDR